MMTTACDMESRYRQLHLLRCNLGRKINIDPQFAAFWLAADINQTAFWKHRATNIHINAFYNLSCSCEPQARRSGSDFILQKECCDVREPLDTFSELDFRILGSWNVSLFSSLPLSKRKSLIKIPIMFSYVYCSSRLLYDLLSHIEVNIINVDYRLERLNDSIPRWFPSPARE